MDSFLEKVNATSKLVDEIHMRNVKNLSLRVGKELKCLFILYGQMIFFSLALEESAKSDRLLPNSGLDRIKAHQHSTLLKRFQSTMEEYNRSQLEYREKCKSRIKLQLKVAGADFDDSKVEDMLESTNPCVFTDVMEQTTAAKKSLMEIEARHADILKLEKSIEEMKEMFAQIALLVEQQGDLIDNIEHNVSLAVDRVDNAKTSVAKAVVTQKRARKVGSLVFYLFSKYFLLLV
ncbi:unnamed protein product [Hymenolepis diminuta]|uniref:t-SNARE coiled-coil homology domain-containing protein n=1 Tax=Hymenolepis diminuta TaxID=6216 RepID=A0A3P7A2Y6_HYMDI|nr:unnamed protein product [Hymenolepis diminuta]